MTLKETIAAKAVDLYENCPVFYNKTVGVAKFKEELSLVAALAFDEAAKAAAAEGDRQGCMDCASTMKLDSLYTKKAAALRGKP